MSRGRRIKHHDHEESTRRRERVNDHERVELDAIVTITNITSMSDQIEDEEHKKQQLVKARTIFEVISFLSTPSSSPSHAQRNVDGPPPPYRYSASKSDHHHGPGSSVPNDFSMTYNITTTEGCVILFVLALWILSLRKLIKNFDKLRTNPIQVPYKYRLKDPENINHVIL